MDKEFFRSREFIVAAIVTGLLVGGGATALAVSAAGLGPLSFEGQGPCRDRTPDAEPIIVEAVDAFHTRGDRVFRDVTYTLNATEFTRGTLDVCTSVGAIRVLPSDDGRVHVRFHIEADGRGANVAVNGTLVDARIAQEGDTLHVGAWVRLVTERSSWLWSDGGTQVSIEVLVPDAAVYDVKAILDVGDVSARDLMTGNLSLSTDVGEVRAEMLHVQGDLRMKSDVGDIDASLLSIRSGNHTYRTDVGDITVSVPGRFDIGYDVVAKNDVGHIEVDLGEDSRLEQKESGAGGRTTARSTGYDERSTRVAIVAAADVGDITITATTT